MSQQGINLQYQNKETAADNGAIIYGVDEAAADIDVLQAQVADLLKRVPLITGVFERVAGSWVALRIKGPFSVSSFNETANGVTVVCSLNEALGTPDATDLPVSVSYQPASVADTTSTRDIAQTLTSSEAGDTVNAGAAHIELGDGTNHAPGDGDHMTVIVWSAQP